MKIGVPVTIKNLQMGTIHESALEKYAQSMGFEIIRINENSWRIEDGGVRFFLLTGTEKALLIDSGMMVKNAKDIAESLTDLPISLLNTHADPDHIGSNEQFETFYMIGSASTPDIVFGWIRPTCPKSEIFQK